MKIKWPIIFLIIVLGCSSYELNEKEQIEAFQRLEQNALTLKRDVNEGTKALTSWLSDEESIRQPEWEAIDYLLKVVSDAIPIKPIKKSQIKKADGHVSHYDSCHDLIVLGKKDSFYVLFTLIHESWHRRRNPSQWSLLGDWSCGRCEKGQRICLANEIEAEIGSVSVIMKLSELCGEPLLDNKAYWRYPIELWPTLTRIETASEFSDAAYLKSLQGCKSNSDLRAWFKKNAFSTESHPLVVQYLYITVAQMLIMAHLPPKEAMAFIKNASLKDVERLITRLLIAHPLDWWVKEYARGQTDFYQRLAKKS